MADEFSERFRIVLSQRLPDLAGHLLDGVNESLELRLPAPSGHGDLTILTIGGEVTLGFGPWHTHFEEFDWHDGEQRGSAFERAISLLVDFLRDLVVIRIWTKQGRYVASGPWHWWYSSESCRQGCLGDHYSAISWSGRGDMPPVPVDPTEMRAWIQSMS